MYGPRQDGLRAALLRAALLRAEVGYIVLYYNSIFAPAKAPHADSTPKSLFMSKPQEASQTLMRRNRSHGLARCKPPTSQSPCSARAQSTRKRPGWLGARRSQRIPLSSPRKETNAPAPLQERNKATTRPCQAQRFTQRMGQAGRINWKKTNVHPPQRSDPNFEQQRVGGGT